MAERHNVRPDDGTIRDLPSFQQKFPNRWESEDAPDRNVNAGYPQPARPWNPVNTTKRKAVVSSQEISINHDTAYNESMKDEDRTSYGRRNEHREPLYIRPLVSQRSEEVTSATRDITPRYIPSPNSNLDTREGRSSPESQSHDYFSVEAQPFQRYGEQHSPPVIGYPAADRSNTRRNSLKPDHDPAARILHESHADSSPWSRKRGQRSSSGPHELDASPTCTPGSLLSAQWSVGPDTNNDTPSSRGEDAAIVAPRRQSFSINTTRGSFNTNGDEARARQILKRDKDAKIEKRSSWRNFVTPKSKSTASSQRELFRAIRSIVHGHEALGPGVVEILLKQFIVAGGDINFVPEQSSLLSVKKRQRTRTDLLDKATTCGDVEVLSLLSPYADKAALDGALKIGLHNRNTGTSRDTSRDDEIIRILVLHGAEDANSIVSATAAGQERILDMLLQGTPAISSLTEALPIAVRNGNTELRRRLAKMLLHKGAKVDSNDGEAILHATKLFDMALLEMLLQCHPRSASLGRAFEAALALTDSIQRFEACHMLIDAGATGEQVNQGLAIAVSTERHNVNFLKLMLRSASVSFEDGRAICQAIAHDLEDHVKLMLARRPNERSFDKALDVALRLPNVRNQSKYCHLILMVGPPQDCCSKALLSAVTSQKDELCRMFLHAGASVDYRGGEAITAAARLEKFGILQLLIGGEFQQPSSTSLAAAFELSLLSQAPAAKRTKMMRLMLEAGPPRQVLDAALNNATQQGQEGLCELLLNYGASVTTHGGSALDICVRSGNLVLLEKLLKNSHRLSSKELSVLFQSSLKLNRRTRYRAMDIILGAGATVGDEEAKALDWLVQERQPDIQAIEVLLARQVSVHHEGHRPLITAAKTFNFTLLTILLAKSTQRSASSRTFEAIMVEEPFWGHREAFTILELLIEEGARGAALDEALLRVVKDERPSARNFENLLVEHANPDYKDGMALRMATQKGDAILIKKMLEKNPSSETVSMAFPYALNAKLSETTCLAVVRCFTAELLYPDYIHPEVSAPPIFLSLKCHPKSLTILNAILDLGFDVDQTMASEEGRYTPLYWVLSGKNKIDDRLVECLIERGANLNKHPEPLLHLAIEHGRHSIVQALLSRGAHADMTDENGLSALNIAVQKKDITSIEALLDPSLEDGVDPQDGSLHDAARMVNTDILKFLLDHGYDPNYECARFEGRPPLFELCLNAPAYLQGTQRTTTQEKERLLKKAINALIGAGALTKDRLARADNRSLLIHALDSADPHMMAKAFLECGQSSYIRNKFNLFMDGEYTYSPTMYVEKGKCRGNSSQSESLSKILKDLGGLDRYWKIHGPQPADMVNPPDDIEATEKARRDAAERRTREEEERRRDRERQDRELEDERRKLAIEQEIASAKSEREERNFRMRQLQDKRLHEASIAKQNDQLAVCEARDRHALMQAKSMSQLRDEEDEAKTKRGMKLLGAQKAMFQSQEALNRAFNMGVEQGGYGSAGGRRTLGPSSGKSNLDLGLARRLRIEQADNRIVEEVED